MSKPIKYTLMNGETDRAILTNVDHQTAERIRGLQSYNEGPYYFKECGEAMDASGSHKPALAGSIPAPATSEEVVS